MNPKSPKSFYGHSSKKSELSTRIINFSEDSEDSELSDSENEIETVTSERFGNSEGIYEGMENREQDSSTSEEEEEVEAENPVSKKKAKYNLTWKIGARITRPQKPWKGSLEEETIITETPLIYFRKMIDTDMLRNVVEQSNLYALQKDVSKPLNLTVPELERFIGITFYMAIYGLPRTRMYWQRETYVQQVGTSMSRNRWEQIKGKLHFNDNVLNDNTDKLYKLRPFINAILSNFYKIPVDEKICVDEQMIPFKGKHSLKQYVPKKPTKWGYKAFVLCDSSGIVHNWDLYSGKIEPVQLVQQHSFTAGIGENGYSKLGNC